MTNDSANWNTSNTNFSSFNPFGVSGLKARCYIGHSMILDDILLASLSSLWISEWDLLLCNVMRELSLVDITDTLHYKLEKSFGQVKYKPSKSLL